MELLGGGAVLVSALLDVAKLLCKVDVPTYALIGRKRDPNT